MKSTIKIASLLIATIAVLALLGWVYAIDNLKQWCDRYVAISMLSPTPKPMTIAVIRTQGKAIAPKAISIKIKESRPNYAEMTTRQLKALCKGTGIKGWENLRKPALVAALSAI